MMVPFECLWMHAFGSAPSLVLVRGLPPFFTSCNVVQCCGNALQGDLLRCIKEYCTNSGIPENQRILRVDVPQWVPDELLAAPRAHPSAAPHTVDGRAGHVDADPQQQQEEAGGNVILQAPGEGHGGGKGVSTCLLYTSPSPRDRTRARMPSSA